MYGTLDTNKKSIEDMKEELVGTNIQYLITTADSKFVEVNEDEIKRQQEKGDE